MTTAEHVYCVCQPGAERPLKQEVAVRAPGLRFAFSRPGFVTFKLDTPTELRRLRLPRLIFARAVGASIGKLTGLASLSAGAERVWSAPGVAALLEAEAPVRLHVWQRDAGVPGRHGFEPGPTALSTDIRDAVLALAPEGAVGHAEDAASGEKRRETALGVALDIAAIEPNEWWLGAHVIDHRVARWPGGTPPLTLPDHAVSRAYLKMREALAWGRLPARKADGWVELGCAPGGASRALLDAGMRVVGVDPAEVDPAVIADPNFRHLRMRAGDAKRKEFASARWLAADINAAPGYTLDAVESVVTHGAATIRGLVLTLKLPDWGLAEPERMLEYFRRVRGWGYRDIRARQLAFNRREVCVVALRSRGQRRVRR